jgi:hypothetical protein
MILVSPALAQTIATNVCAIGRDPAAFDGKIVRLRATIVSGFEASGIRDPEDDRACTIWLTYSGGGPVASTSLVRATTTVQRPPIKLKKDRHFRRFQNLLHAEMHPRDRGNFCISCARYEVTATLTGRVDYAGQGLGFGHLNAYRVQFVLASVRNVAAADLTSKYDPEFSAKPVKFPTAFLQGSVRTPEGRPVSDAEVNVTSTMDVPAYLHDFATWTDEKGRFKFAVPPGTYLLGMNLETPPSPAVPFAATYYPGTPDGSAATKLSVKNGQHLNGLVIHLSPRLQERSISLKVIWPDGRPVEQANVWLAELRNPTQVVGGAVSHTTSDGTFGLVGFQGIDYFVHADIYAKPQFTPYCAEVRTLKSDEPVPQPLEMILTRTGEPCRGD